MHGMKIKIKQPYTICSVDISSTGFSFNVLCTQYNQNWCYALQSYNQMCLDITTHTAQFSSSLFHFIMPQVSCNVCAIGGFPLNFTSRLVSLTSVKLIAQLSNHK
jgi:hypothetical protein